MSDASPPNVACLGVSYASEEARRERFLGLLREHLRDPAARAAAGFPQGRDEDILRISDPPHYTACPNPFVGEVMQRWLAGREPRESTRAPFVAELAVGKSDPIYNAHAYHTKVPHRAIQRYIEHYTDPGDIVLDCFCGTGQTGVACAELAAPRRAVLCDLSPAASLIAYNYCTSGESPRDRAITGLVARLQSAHGWMYETKHSGWLATDRRVRRSAAENPGRSEGRCAIQFVVWSDLFLCGRCGARVNYWFAAASEEEEGLAERFPCPQCGVSLRKADLERIWTTVFDRRLASSVRVAAREPVLIQYEHGGRVFHKVPDDADRALLARCETLEITDAYPVAPIAEGDRTVDPRSVGITHAHLFYTRRNLAVLAGLWREVQAASAEQRGAMQFLFTSTLPWTTRLNRLLAANFFKKRGGAVGQTLPGTLHVPPVSVETNPIYRLGLLASAPSRVASGEEICVSTQSATDLRPLPDDSVDYVFIDPPFGHNLVYSDLNVLWESWLNVYTARASEAVVSAAQGKGLAEYEALMRQAFREIFRVLRPGRWVTIELHDNQDAVWRALQRALGAAGLVIAEVTALAKPTRASGSAAVRKGMVVSAYKPGQALVEAFRRQQSDEAAAWACVTEHLAHLPVVRRVGEGFAPVRDRQPQDLFHHVVATFVQRGIAVPISAKALYGELPQRFTERDGMYFLPEQAREYDRMRASPPAMRPASSADMEGSTAEADGTVEAPASDGTVEAAVSGAEEAAGTAEVASSSAMGETGETGEADGSTEAPTMPATAATAEPAGTVEMPELAAPETGTAEADEVVETAGTAGADEADEALEVPAVSSTPEPPEEPEV